MITRLIIGTALIALVASCSKDIEVRELNFDVTGTKKDGSVSQTYTTSDTINFSFTGNPDVVSFYSGEVGRRYEYRERTSAEGTPVLQFTSLRANGSQSGSLALLVSSDFKGVVLKPGTSVKDTAATTANLAAANWTDITNQATLSTGTAAASGSINLSAYAAEGKPVFIAFKYKALSGSIQNKWTITALSLANNLADGTSYTIANLNAPTTAITNYFNISYSPGWTVFLDAASNANQYAWVYTAGTSLVITGATTASAATAPAEAWAVMGPLDLRKVTPDAGVGLKNITMKLENYLYKFSSANNGKVTFVGSNSSPDQTQKKVKELELKVNP